MYFIIKSDKKGEENWSGKEFSSYPAKIYTSMEDVADTLDGYWFSEHVPYPTDLRPITIIPLSEDKKDKLLSVGVIRF